jgi:hypothetical protein
MVFYSYRMASISGDAKLVAMNGIVEMVALSFRINAIQKFLAGIEA